MTGIVLCIEPGQVQELNCSSSGPSELQINWKEPALNADNVVDYVVEVSQYVQPEGLQVLQLADLDPPFGQAVRVRQATVLEGIGEFEQSLML